MVKSFLLLSALFVFVACTSTQEMSAPETASNFMTKAEIFSELKEKSSLKYMDSPLTEADKERLGKLIEPDIFFAHEKSVVETKSQKDSSFQGSAEVDLRSRDTSVKSQDNGKCTAYAGVAAIENTLNRDGKIPNLDLSEWDAWSNYGEYSCEAFIKAATKYTICDEKYYPQYGKKSALCDQNSYAKIAEQTYLGNNIKKVVEALDRGNVVYTGMSTPMDIVKCRKVVSKNTTVSNGGHALLVTGYYMEAGEVVLMLKNSWGKGCADNGYHYFPASVCARNDMYCMFWEIAKVSTDKPTEPQCKEWKRIWYKPWVKFCSRY